jgi:hypothetical protein
MLKQRKMIYSSKQVQAQHRGNTIKNITINGNVITTLNGKVWVPKALQQCIVSWYHDILQHVGVAWMVNSISQIFGLKGMQTMVEKHFTSWDSCQCNKLSNKKPHGKIPLNPVLCNKNPWDKVR